MIGIGLYITETKWNKETCLELAKTCKSRSEFRKKSSKASAKAYKNGWIDDYDWFKEVTNLQKWNKETCRDAAKEYRIRADFKKNNGSAYNVARRNGWLDTYDWFLDGKEISAEKRRIWNKETCLAAAKECTSRAEFSKKYVGAYTIALKNGWLDDYDWFKEKKKCNYWNEETCRIAAKECTSRGDFLKKFKTAYDMARKNGWIDDYTWLKDERFNLYKDKIDSVYVYEFPELNAAYVGRTLMRTLQKRDRAHIFDTEHDAVAKFAKENDVAVPKPKYLELDLTIDQGAKLEGYWEKYYRDQGWNMLNRTKTGSIGSLGKGKWNKEACERVAKECTSRKDFQDKNASAYHVAQKNGWLEDYDWFKEKKKFNYWNEETCRIAAKECKTRGEFAKKYGSAYLVACRNSWIDTYDWFENGHKNAGEMIRKWNKETCLELAKTCKTRTEMRKKANKAYEAARKNGWIDEYTWFLDGKEISAEKRTKWDEETCRAAANDCKSRVEFSKKYKRAYQKARTNGWLDSYDWFQNGHKLMGERNTKWNEETCRAAAKECTTRSEFAKKYDAAYRLAKKNGWIEELFPPKHLKECLISDIKPLSAYLQYQRI